MHDARSREVGELGNLAGSGSADHSWLGGDVVAGSALTRRAPLNLNTDC